MMKYMVNSQSPTQINPDSTSSQPPAVTLQHQPVLQQYRTPKQKSKLTIVLTALVFCLLGTTAYFSYHNYQLQQQIIQKQVPPTLLPKIAQQSEIPGATPFDDITSDWKTYTSQDYGYSIKYPSSWYLYEPETSSAYSKNTVGFWPRKGEGEVPGIWVTIGEVGFSYTDLDSWWEQYKKGMITPLDVDSIEEKKTLEVNFDDFIRTEKIVISGQPALKVNSTEHYKSRPIRSVYIIDQNNEIIQINTNITDADDQYYEYFDQILSTFKLDSLNTATGTLTDEQLYALVDKHKTELIENSGANAKDISYENVSEFDDGIYQVSLGWLDENDEYIPSGGSWVLVGKENNQWVVSWEGEPYCTWLKNSSVDEVDKIFMGLELCN